MSRLASATNWPMKPVAPTIRTLQVLLAAGLTKDVAVILLVAVQSIIYPFLSKPLFSFKTKKLSALAVCKRDRDRARKKGGG